MNITAPGRDLAPRLAYAMLIAYLGICAVAFAFGVLFYTTRPAPLLVGALFFAVCAVECVPALRGIRDRICRPPLVLITALAYLPFLVFDEWLGIVTLYSGVVLLRMRPPWSWWAFACVVAAQAPLAYFIWPGDPERLGFAVLYNTVNAANTGLGLYGLARLLDLIAGVRGARHKLATDAVLAERLRAARDLDGLLGSALRAIAAGGRAALPRPRSADFEPVVRTARDALGRARKLASGYRDRDSRGGDADHAEVSPKLALPILIWVHAGFIIIGIGAQALIPGGLTGGRLVVFVPLLAAIFALQLRHTALRERLAGTAGGYATLAVQAALTCVVLVVMDDRWTGTMGFLAGSVLLIVAAPRSWLLAGAIVVGSVSYPVVVTGVDDWLRFIGLFVLDMLATVLLVYGLTRLTELTRRLRDARAELARMAVLEERLRFARDVHDLYGFTLSAIILKGELVRRVAGTDPDRAKAEIAEIVEMAEAALAELGSAARSDGAGGAGDRDLSLSAESAAARRLLSAVGVQVRGEMRAGSPGPPADVALAIVLREAVTNVLRHSAARRVTLETSEDAGRVRMRIANDGVPGQPPGPPGTGIANLTARVQAVGGELTAGPRGTGFELVAEVPAVGPGGAIQGVSPASPA